jgi:lysozyme family protein
MKANFASSLAAVLVHEGGYVNDPDDPGGATNKGVTQAVYDAYRVRNKLARQSVKGITSDEIGAIYRTEYWNRIKGDDLPAGVDYAVFDFAVNSGVGRASRFLQAVVGVEQDGAIGPRTIAAITSPARTVDALSDKRLAFLRQLPTFGHFGNGWSARVADVRIKGREMAS